MKTQKRVAFVVTFVISGLMVTAAQPPRIPAWYEGERVTFTVVNDNVVDVDRETLEEVANPLFAFGPPGNQPQADIISFVPGEAGYSPWWEVYMVTVLNGRNVTTNPFTSVDELLDAEAAGQVRIDETETFFLCQVLFGGRR
jgi:hypothetical protein